MSIDFASGSDVIGAQTAILAAIAGQTALIKELITMSQTLEQQIQSLTAAVAADNQALTTALSTIATEIANLISQLQPGATVSQADVDALTAAKTSLDVVVATAQNMANPPPPPAP